MGQRVSLDDIKKGTATLSRPAKTVGADVFGEELFVEGVPRTAETSKIVGVRLTFAEAEVIAGATGPTIRAALRAWFAQGAGK